MHASRAQTPCASSASPTAARRSTPATPRSGRRRRKRRGAAAELGVTDYVHLDLPDMRLDTLPHVDVNRVVEEQSATSARRRLLRPAGRQPRPPRAVRLGRRGDAARARPVRAARADVRADLEHRVDAGGDSTGSSRTGSSTSRARSSTSSRPSRATAPRPATSRIRAGSARSGPRRRSSGRLRLRGGRAVRARALARRLIDRHRRCIRMAEKKQSSKGFAAEERRSDEGARAGAQGGSAREQARADGKRDLLAKIAEMPPSDRSMAKGCMRSSRPTRLTWSPRTWYGMPAYARDGKVVCFFQAADSSRRGTRRSASTTREPRRRLHVADRVRAEEADPRRRGEDRQARQERRASPSG